MARSSCPLCFIEAHTGNPDGTPEPLTIAERALIEMTAREGKRVDVPSVCLEHDDFLKLQEKGLVYTLQPVRHGHLCWWRLTEEGKRIARELGFKVKDNPSGKCSTIRDVLESECLKAKRTIDATLGNKWPFCEILNEYFRKCSSHNPGNPGKLVGLEAYFGEAVPVLRKEKAIVLEERKPGIPFKIKISYSKYKMKTEYEVLTTGIMRGMGWRARERTMKIRVTIPWLTSTYSVRLDDVMEGIGFLPTKRLKKERDENATAYLRETSTLHSHTEEDQAANLEEYTRKVRRVLDKLYDEEKDWEPVAVHA